jgi:hypothetical protein
MPKQSRADSNDSDELKKQLKETDRRIFEINTVFNKQDPDRQFKSNIITTAKYNMFTFLPLNLFEQFCKMANLYFLILTMMELYEPISDSGG